MAKAVAMLPALHHAPLLPWTTPEEERRRLRKIALFVFIVSLLFAIIMPLLSVPKIDREKARELPPRLARLLLEQQQRVEPPPKPEPAPEVSAPEPVKEPAATPKEPPKPAVPDVAKARERAARAGLLAFKDELAALRDDSALEGLKKSEPLQRGAGEQAAVPERSLVVADAARTSGGINTAALSRDTGGGNLAGRAGTQVTSPVADTPQPTRSASARKAARSVEEIQLVFDKNKSAIYALYNRALRSDPTLQGKVVLRITIEPSGRVKACEIVSSELRDAELERKVVARVMLFDFGPKDVETVVVTYPIDFLPS